MRAFIAAVVFIASIHIYVSFMAGESPITIPFIIILLTPFLPYFWGEISSLKFGKDGLEIERLKSDVDKTIRSAVHGNAISPKSIDDLFKTVELNEWITLVLARMLMRKGLLLLVPDEDLGASPSLLKLIVICHERSLVTDSERTDLEKLRNITFYAEWWGGDAPTHGEWRWALENCKRIVKSLFEKQPIA